MLQPKFELESIEANGLTRLYLKDVTGNYGDIYYEKQGGGTFLQKTNDWGYGAPNPTRDSVAVIFAAIHKQHRKDVWLNVESYNSTDPLIDTVSFEYPKDGYHQFYMFAIQKYDAAATYQIGDYAFYPDGTKNPYYGEVKILQDVDDWLVVTVEELIANYVNTDYKDMSHDIIFAKSYSKLKDLDSERRDSIIDKNKCKDTIDELKKEWDGYILIREIDRAKENGYYTLGERMCRAAELLLK